MHHRSLLMQHRSLLMQHHSSLAGHPRPGLDPGDAPPTCARRSAASPHPPTHTHLGQRHCLLQQRPRLAALRGLLGVCRRKGGGGWGGLLRLCRPRGVGEGGKPGGNQHSSERCSCAPPPRLTHTLDHPPPSITPHTHTLVLHMGQALLDVLHRRGDPLAGCLGRLGRLRGQQACAGRQAGQGAAAGGGGWWQGQQACAGRQAGQGAAPGGGAWWRGQQACAGRQWVAVNGGAWWRDGAGGAKACGGIGQWGEGLAGRGNNGGSSRGGRWGG